MTKVCKPWLIGALVTASLGAGCSANNVNVDTATPQQGVGTTVAQGVSSTLPTTANPVRDIVKVPLPLPDGPSRIMPPGSGPTQALSIVVPVSVSDPSWVSRDAATAAASAEQSAEMTLESAQLVLATNPGRDWSPSDSRPHISTVHDRPMWMVVFAPKDSVSNPRFHNVLFIDAVTGQYVYSFPTP